MDPLSRRLASALASTDGFPHVIRHSGATLFLVTPLGEVWRVYDSDGPEGERREPSNDPGAWARIFIGSGSDGVTRIHRFTGAETRAIDAEHLWKQFGASTIGDERHV